MCIWKGTPDECDSSELHTTVWENIVLNRDYMQGNGYHSQGNLKWESWPVWSYLSRKSRKTFLGDTRTIIREWLFWPIPGSQCMAWDTPGLLQFRWDCTYLLPYPTDLLSTFCVSLEVLGLSRGLLHLYSNSIGYSSLAMIKLRSREVLNF